MSQSALLVGLLALGFVLYVAARGRLTTYTGVLWGKSATANSGGSGDSGSSGGGGFADAFKTAATIFKYAPEVAAVVA